MKRIFLVGALLLLSSVASNAQSPGAPSSPEDLAKAKNCLMCHAVSVKVVGPAFKDVAAKYAGQKGAEDKLIQKVLKGGSGVWGTVPMPPSANVSDEEAAVLVKWVLSQK
jgi:cytochrome c